MKLRHDDPAAMKDFIQSVQNRVNVLKATSEDGESNTNNKRVIFVYDIFQKIL